MSDEASHPQPGQESDLRGQPSEPGTPVPGQQPGESHRDEDVAEPVPSQADADLNGDRHRDEDVAEPVPRDQGPPPVQPEAPDSPTVATPDLQPGNDSLTDQSSEASPAASKNTIDQAELDALTASAKGQAALDRTRSASARPGPGGDRHRGEDAARPVPRDAEPAGDQDHVDDPIMQAMAAIEAEAAAEGSAAAEDGADQEGRTGPSVVGATPVAVSAEDATEFAPPELSASRAPEGTNIDMLDDVELEVKIELGRTNMYIEDVLKLGPGSVVELDKLAGDPVDIYVNERLIARGEVLVLNDNFCVRINSIHSPVPELDHG
jgi:flagellar motor switch protein FliN/FliY